MLDAVRHWLLRLMRVPPKPHPPAGAPGTLRVFRAGKNFLKLRLFAWGFGQVVAFAGIAFWIWVFADLAGAAADIKENRARIEQTTAAGRSPAASVPASPAQPAASSVAPAPTNPSKPARKAAAPARRKRSVGEVLVELKRGLALAVAQLPRWAYLLLWVLKIFAVLAYLVQLPISYAIARFDYEMRWYLVTDRSLRLRHGIWNLEESTMSFVNLQQVLVTQGPLQRLLGLADVRVQSAGGGSGDPHHQGGGDTLHTAVFRAVDNAHEIRDLILDRLRQFWATGLGDPDDHPVVPATAIARGAPPDALAAARELLEETRALRRALG